MPELVDLLLDLRPVLELEGERLRVDCFALLDVFLRLELLFFLFVVDF
ncbi:MAG: hypothetical protein U9R58_04035 [Chloroflexota bacterium]|nr:hypothetical protein [Chloroflexota bacterium]